ncbi:Hsp70 family protein [Actinoplanes sp. NPDC051470]|uniref:Hsp70 family protein n=1 Tax=Actinoplanes sp. NPDC051470 TaxID=3157224 RepID=UPI003421F2D8
MRVVSEWDLGVDFGTSNTAAAYRSGAAPAQVVRLSSAADQVTSAVLMTPAGELKAGAEAVSWAMVHPEGFEPSPKALLHEVGGGQTWLGDHDVQVADLIAAVLTMVLRRGQELAGPTPPARLFLTHPAAWSATLTDVLVEAARRARIVADPAQVTLVPEPVAAATRYVLRRGRPLPAGSVVAVCDLGGGTTDVALLRADEPGRARWTVLAERGARVGGNLFDSRMRAWVDEQLRARGRDDLLAALADPANLAAVLTLRELIRGAKHTLSDGATVAPVAIAAAGLQDVLMVTASDLSALIAGEVDQVAGLLTAALADAGLERGDVAALYLTGGTSHVPQVQSRLAAVLDRPAEPYEDDPKTVTPLGALDSTTLSRPASRPPPRGPASSRSLTPLAPRLRLRSGVVAAAFARIRGEALTGDGRAVLTARYPRGRVRAAIEFWPDQGQWQVFDNDPLLFARHVMKGPVDAVEAPRPPGLRHAALVRSGAGGAEALSLLCRVPHGHLVYGGSPALVTGTGLRDHLVALTDGALTVAADRLGLTSGDAGRPGWLLVPPGFESVREKLVQRLYAAPGELFGSMQARFVTPGPARDPAAWARELALAGDGARLIVEQEIRSATAAWRCCLSESAATLSFAGVTVRPDGAVLVSLDLVKSARPDRRPKADPVTAFAACLDAVEVAGDPPPRPGPARDDTRLDRRVYGHADEVYGWLRRTVAEMFGGRFMDRPCGYRFVDHDRRCVVQVAIPRAAVHGSFIVVPVGSDHGRPMSDVVFHAEVVRTAVALKPNPAHAGTQVAGMKQAVWQRLTQSFEVVAP